jgi:Protein of unknown function (DUF3025)
VIARRRAAGLPEPACELIHWDRPWYRPWSPWAAPVHARVQAGLPIWQALQAAGAGPIRFVAASERDPRVPYEVQIAHGGGCPTRECWHDFFNGLCWLRYPRTKARLNHLHAMALSERGPGAARGSLRDAVTLFDENAALLWAPDALWQALVDKDWQTLFGPLRPLWARSRVEVFGHAMLDKLRAPRKSLTAHILRVPESVESDSGLDAWLDRLWTDHPPSPKDFAHLPLLGVPGWWAANEDPSFHRDASVFRGRTPALAQH